MVVSALSLIASCERWENRYLKRAVTESEIVGRWRMTPTSVEDLQRVGHTLRIDPSLHTITLRSGGTCHFSTFPTALTSQGRPSAPIDQECKWSLRKKGGQALLIDLATDPVAHTHLYLERIAKASYSCGVTPQTLISSSLLNFVEYKREA
jgi:hypothetical protein